jgi:hypothetical protein
MEALSLRAEGQEAQGTRRRTVSTRQCSLHTELGSAELRGQLCRAFD